MKFAFAVALFGCAALMTGCVTVRSEQSFNAERELLVGSPAFYAQQVAQCTSNIAKNPKALRGAVLATSLPEDRAPAVICERFAKAQRDGKLTYEEYVSINSGHGISPAWVRIAQGR